MKSGCSKEVAWWEHSLKESLIKVFLHFPNSETFYFRSFASPSLAGSWDNVGLLVEPSPPHRVNSLLLTNDLTAAVMKEALQHKGGILLVVADRWLFGVEGAIWVAEPLTFLVPHPGFPRQRGAYQRCLGTPTYYLTYNCIKLNRGLPNFPVEIDEYHFVLLWTVSQH